LKKKKGKKKGGPFFVRSVVFEGHLQLPRKGKEKFLNDGMLLLVKKKKTKGGISTRRRPEKVALTPFPKNPTGFCYKKAKRKKADLCRKDQWNLGGGLSEGGGADRQESLFNGGGGRIPDVGTDGSCSGKNSEKLPKAGDTQF